MSQSNIETEPRFSLMKWCGENPLAVALLAAVVGTLAYFFGAVHLFVNRAQTAAEWAMRAWNPEQNQEHSNFVLPIALVIGYLHWDEVVKAPKKGNQWGLAFVAFGILLYLLSARCLEPRIALVSLPFLTFGSILYLWGNKVARILFFPCAFLIFLVPFGAAEQATFKLQFIITDTVSALANLVGISNHTGGTTIIAQDSSFHFEVAEGCSGIRSITAITMLSTIFVHLMETQLWKKVVIVSCSAIFAIIGNICRIFTILLVAKLFNADIAGGKYHTISGYISFPFAILAMFGLWWLLNLKKGGTPGESHDGGIGPGLLKPRKASHDYDY